MTARMQREIALTGAGALLPFDGGLSNRSIDPSP
jgi:hypothetical protein